jgi:nitrate reductase molybdenum cofactor assembly chaperone NarJ/NarW
MKAGPRDPVTLPPPARDVRDACAVTLQAASLLLSYPSRGCGEDLDLVRAALSETPRAPGRRSLERFVAWWRKLDAGARECTYVETFDFGAGLSLYLTEAQPRASRDRGGALLRLRRAYREAGADVRGDELPDYLPLMLEAAAQRPACRELLAGQREAVQALQAGLERAQSPFVLVADAVLAAVASLPPVRGRPGGEP